MSSELFRKSALQKLSSPEQLDQLISITSPRAWIALGTLGGLLIAALLWGIFGSVPTKTAGQGILLKKGGVSNVVATGSGILTGLDALKSGDTVNKGQVIGHIAQPVLEQEIRHAEQSLNDLGKERDRIARFVDNDLQLQKQSLVQQQSVYRQALQAKQEQIRSLEVTLGNQDGLRKDGLITQQKYQETRQRIYAAQQEFENTQNQLQQLKIQELNLKNQHQERMQAIEDKILDAESRLKDLHARLDVASRIVSPYTGKVVEAIAAVGDMMRENAPVLSVEFEERNLEAVIYLPPQSEIKRVRPGTPVQISPDTAKREEYGFMLGQVASISKFPATPQGMMALLNNEGLVRMLSQQGAPIAVYVDVLPDPETVSRYRWSSRAGASVEVSSGTLCTASILIREQAPITLVIPLLKRFLGV
jgi:HlyD family secretion protein